MDDIRQRAKAEAAKLRALEAQAWMALQAAEHDAYLEAIGASGGVRGAVLAHWTPVTDSKIVVRRVPLEDQDD